MKAWWTPRRWIEEFWKDWTINWLKSWELKDSLNITEIEEKITEEWLKKSSATLFKKWTLLIAMYWATAWEVWILWVDSSTNQAVCSIIPKIEINKNYLFWILFLYRQKIKSETFWWAQPNISKDYLDNLKIPLPSLEIQNQIVEKMDFALGEKKRKELEAKTLLESIDDFVLSELWIEYKEVEEKKVFGLKLSELWETKRLDPSYNFPKYLEFDKSLKNWKYQVSKIWDVSKSIFQWSWIKKWDNNIWYLKVKNLDFNNIIDFEDIDYTSNVSVDKILQNWDILSPFIWEAVKKIKFTVFENNSEKVFSIDNNTWVIRLKNTNPYFVAIFLSWISWKIQIEKLIGWWWVPFLWAESAKNLQIPLPPLEIQEKIALEVKTRIEKAKVLESEAREIYESAKREVEGMILD